MIYKYNRFNKKNILIVGCLYKYVLKEINSKFNDYKIITIIIEMITTKNFIQNL
jgi:hypothetical protein